MKTILLLFLMARCASAQTTVTSKPAVIPCSSPNNGGGLSCQTNLVEGGAIALSNMGSVVYPATISVYTLNPSYPVFTAALLPTVTPGHITGTFSGYLADGVTPVSGTTNQTTASVPHSYPCGRKYCTRYVTVIVGGTTTFN